MAIIWQPWYSTGWTCERGEALEARRVTLIGPPGSGKGTQADRIARHLRVPPIHVGALLRRQAADTTPVGRTTREFLDRGDLLPDRPVTRMVLDRIDQPDCAGGFVLEGFPRTIGQAEALDRHLAARGTALDAACYLEVPDEELWRRLAGRGRVDDNEGVIRHRLTVFTTQTRPLLAYYRDRGRLLVIDAVGPVEVVTERILAGLARLAGQPGAVDRPASPPGGRRPTPRQRSP
jgi:adenylate kinase